MSFPKKIIKVRPIGGIVNDLPPSEVANEFYTSGNNVHFRSSFAERTQGHARVYTGVAKKLRNIINFRVGTENFWVYHGVSSSFVISSGAETSITLAGGLTSVEEQNRWTSDLLNGVHFANNGADAPMFWSGVPAERMLVLPGWPAGTVCKAMRAFKFHLFAMDISGPTGDFEEQILWSNAAQPGAIPQSWTPLATNDSGDAQLSATPGNIIDGRALRSSFIFYKQHSSYIADFVGGNNIFNFRRLLNASGVLTRNCIADYKGQHFVVTADDIVLTDGSVTNSIVDNRMRKFLFNQLDQDNHENVFVVAYPKQNEVWVCFPSAGNTFCDLAMVWDGVANAWGVREIPDISHAAIGIVSDLTVPENWDSDSATWDSDTTTWNQQNFSSIADTLVLAKTDDVVPANSRFFEVDSGKTFDGTNINAIISKYAMAFDEPNRIKFIRRIVPHITAAAGTQVLIRIGSQMTINEPIAWSAEITYVVGTDIQVSSFAQGKFLSFEFRSTGANPWTLVGFDVEAEVRGYY